MTTCARCNKSLPDGSTAFVQTERRVDVRGKQVTFSDVDVVVCEECA